MERPQSRELREIKFAPVELTIKEPDGVHNSFGIEFDAPTIGQCMAYKNAIKIICTEAKLSPFHQSGSDEKKGWQYFEFWTRTNKDTVSELLPLIHEEAKKEFEILKGMGMFE